jgi:uncharacterized protein
MEVATLRITDAGPLRKDSFHDSNGLFLNRPTQMPHIEPGGAAMERQDLVLAALAAGGENASYWPVQVQKLLFLIDREASALVNGPHFDFKPYDYGPFDRAVYLELDSLAAQGLINIQNTGRYRVYSLTPEGYRQGSSNLSQVSLARSYIEQAARWVRSLSFQQLVAAIYRRYPDMKVNSVFRV